MIANYHTHTSRCRHAVGQDREYAAAAFQSGMHTLGFSDHAPYWFEGDYYSHMRMFREQLPEYVESVRGLQKEYAGKMEIRLGLETEYYPKFFATTLEHIRQAGIEYIILGQHWVGNEEGEPYSGRPTEDETLLARHCDQTIEAMSTGLFTYLAHPDLLNYVGPEQIYRQHLRRVCRAAVEQNMPVEINFVGLRQGRHYPNPRFWSIAGEEGCKVIFGCDAHDPAHFLEKETEQAALQLVERFGLDLVSTVPLRRI